jgi:hypothetical protein
MGISHMRGFAHVTGDTEPTRERYQTDPEGWVIPHGWPDPWAADPEVQEQLEKAGTRTVEILEKLEGVADDKDPRRRDTLTAELNKSIDDAVNLTERLKKKHGASISKQVTKCFMPPPGADGGPYGPNNPFFVTLDHPTSTEIKNLTIKYDGLMRGIEKDIQRNKAPSPTTCRILKLMIYGNPPEGAKRGQGGEGE